MKLSYKEKEQVLATSKAQSILSSRQSSRKGSMDISRVMDDGGPDALVTKAKTI
jgi:hypothetical protein